MCWKTWGKENLYIAGGTIDSLAIWERQPDGGGRCACNSRSRSLLPQRALGHRDKETGTHVHTRLSVSQKITVLHSAGTWMIKVRLTHAMECCMFVKMNITYMYLHELPNWKPPLPTSPKMSLLTIYKDLHKSEHKKENIGTGIVKEVCSKHK